MQGFPKLVGNTTVQVLEMSGEDICAACRISKTNIVVAFHPVRGRPARLCSPCRGA